MKFVFLITIVTAALTEIPTCGGGKSYTDSMTALNKLIEIYNYPEIYNLKKKAGKELKKCYDSLTLSCKRKDSKDTLKSIIDKLKTNSLPQSRVLRNLVDKKVAKCQLRLYSCKKHDSDYDFIENTRVLLSMLESVPKMLKKKYEIEYFQCKTGIKNSPFSSCSSKDSPVLLQAKLNYFEGLLSNYYGPNGSKKMIKLIFKQVGRCREKYAQVSRLQ